MCKRNSPNKNKKTKQHGMCKRNSPHKKKVNMGCVRESTQLKNEASTGCLIETPHRKMKPAQDV